MNGILIINKPIGMTSHDVVAFVRKTLNIKKVGHTGTLDPNASGVLVLLLGTYTKYSNDITNYEKEYFVKVKTGIKTDTLDIDGKIIEEKQIILDKEQLTKDILYFKKTYNQEVPIYSAIKIDGKKLYEYARENKEVILPKREVTIKEIKDINIEKKYFSFKCLVTKGTYIRSLIKDICDKNNIIGTVYELKRTKQGNYNIEESYTLDDIKNNNFKLIQIDNHSLNQV